MGLEWNIVNIVYNIDRMWGNNGVNYIYDYTCKVSEIAVVIVMLPTYKRVIFIFCQ